MTRILKMTKYHLLDSIRQIAVYYGIMILLLSFIGVFMLRSEGSISSSGLEFTTVIFLFIAGLNSFKSSFKFSQANNISRKSYFAALVLSVLSIAFGMSVADILLNRIYNLFVPCPMLYDMSFGSKSGDYAGVYQFSSRGAARVWFQSNDFYTLFSTLVWLFAIYAMLFMLGIFITTLFYRCNKALKFLIWFCPIGLLIIVNRLAAAYVPFGSFIEKLSHFFYNVFCVDPWICMLGFVVIAAVAAAIAFLLMRRAPVKN